MTAVAAMVPAVAARARSGGSAASSATSAAERDVGLSSCPTPVSGPWSGTTVQDVTGNTGSWAASFAFSRGSGSTWRVTGTFSQTTVPKAPVVGTVHCAAVNIGSGGFTFSGTIAPDGKAVSGTWAAGDNGTGTWTGRFSPPPAIVVTPSTALVDGRSLSVHGTNFAKSAQIAIYQCPATARLGSDCDLARPPARVTANAAGAFTIVRPVYQTLVTTNGAVNCVKTPCLLRAENSQLASEFATASISFAKANVACRARLICRASLSESASVRAPGQTVSVVGQPTHPTGTLLLDVSLGVLPCPHLPAAITPIADLIDTGFAPTARLAVTETLHLATATDPEQVCFNSSVPFKSQSSPKVAKAGTALLLDCSAVANTPPCVQSRSQIGAEVVLKFVVPGGDPRFYIVCPHGRQVWLSRYGTAQIGKKYAAQLQSSGGKSPIHWKVASGKLPEGCTLDAARGAITGTPMKRGRYSAVVQATDSENPPQNASMPVPITVK